MANAFSIRTQLQGELLDFLKSSGFDCAHTTALVRDLTCLLASYREEDIPLFPDVFVLPSPEVLSSLSPGTQRFVIGSTVLETAAERVLKECANLAVGGWAIYVAKTEENGAEFGVFQAVIHSFATTAEEAMVESEKASPTILIRNRGRLVVELRNAKNERFTALFTSAPASESQFAQHVADFATAVVGGLPHGEDQKFEPYLRRLLTDTLQHCHGTLLAAHVPPEGGQALTAFGDGVWLVTPVDLAIAHRTAVEAKDAQSLAALAASESLLRGMIASDGVVVFSTKGTILGYRVYLKPNDSEKCQLPDEGGGRKRTFELMRLRLGTSLIAAFYRSQDGQTECTRVQS